ncbi:MAG TPA: hypothetical protein VFI53_19985 [Myxococcaceae bacterium]|nr:hypothetical protein [Myxococcaceae bacterium]
MVRWRSALALSMGLCVLSMPALAGPGDDLARLYGDFDGLQREYGQLSSGVESFLAGSRELREMDRDEITRLIIQICNLDIARNNDAEEQIATSLTKDVQSKVRSKYETLEATGKEWQYKVSQLQEKLKTTAYYTEPYTKMDEVKSDASKLMDQIKTQRELAGRLWDKIDADYKTLTNIQNGSMLGANNPKIRAAMDWGKAKHEYNQRICEEKEVVLPSGRRPDCISFQKDACVVWEFKPSTVGESKAKEQAESYIPEVKQYFKNNSKADNCKKDSNGLPEFEAKGVTYQACTPSSS